jgi:hypothetical protein
MLAGSSKEAQLAHRQPIPQANATPPHISDNLDVISCPLAKTALAAAKPYLFTSGAGSVFASKVGSSRECRRLARPPEITIQVVLVHIPPQLSRNRLQKISRQDATRSGDFIWTGERAGGSDRHHSSARTFARSSFSARSALRVTCWPDNTETSGCAADLKREIPTAC